MFGLVAGGLSISMAPNERGPYFSHFARPGSWFGELAAFTGQPRRVGLAATRGSELLHLPLRGIREIVDNNPAAWRLFALVAIGHLDRTMATADDQRIRDRVQRCIAVLLRLGGCRLSSLPDALPVDIDISQEDFAFMANVARTTAGAILRKLEASGHVEQAYRRIRILAPDALRALLRD